MSRVNNHVFLLGTVVKGVSKYYTPSGKARATYQIRIEPRNVDKGLVQTPFIRSVGHQAEKDIEKIKIGDVILVEGRLLTRTETKTYIFVPSRENPSELLIYNPADESQPFYDDSEILTAKLARPVTEVMAEEVFYFSDFVSNLPDEEKLRLFNPKVLKNVISDYQEDTGEDLMSLLEKTLAKSNED